MSSPSHASNEERNLYKSFKDSILTSPIKPQIGSSRRAPPAAIQRRDFTAELPAANYDYFGGGNTFERKPQSQYPRTRQEILQDRGLFESSREDEDDEDEDYSLGEDLAKNRQNYKYDELW